MPYQRLAVILGNQLFPDHGRLRPDENTLFFMAEDTGLCTHFKYHKHKLMLFLSAMRSHRDALADKHAVHYVELTARNQGQSYEDKLRAVLEAHGDIGEVVTYDVEDKFMDQRLRQFCRAQDLTLTTEDSPLFLTTRAQFDTFLDKHRTSMQVFYQWQRRRLGVLVDEQGKPRHGQWSFDADNRKKLPRDLSVPDLPQSQRTDHTEAVAQLVDTLFADHPGQTDNFHWATTRRAAFYQLDNFLKERFAQFGPYEDALSTQHRTVFHSVLSPYINMGLITPDEVVDKALAYADAHDVHFPSVEGFVRQVIGWREFMRGMYHTHDLEKNYFDHTRRLGEAWYTGDTGIPPLDDVIARVTTHGYAHHIERLMVAGNLMLLCEISPDEVYKWFMELFVDSSDWVMVPNVYGMSQFADGGTFATKPYVAGANYLLKMSDYRKGDWAETVNGLYWRFINAHRDLFGSNPRMAMMVSMFDKKSKPEQRKLLGLADDFIGRVTQPAG